MNRRYLTTSTEVLFLASLLASVGQAGYWQEFALWPASNESRPSQTGRDEQEAPDI